MQWLIDIAKEAMQQWIYDNGIYRQRPAYGMTDFNQDTLTLDGAWHELDLSAIVPEHAKAANLSLIVLTPTVNSMTRWRHTNQVIPGGKCVLRTQVADINMRQIWAQGIDSDRKCEYMFSNTTWTSIGLVVRGWWF